MKSTNTHTTTDAAATAAPFVLYYRVSTKKQGDSGLGLAAQKTDVARFLKTNGGEAIASFTEIESGKINARPELKKALRLAVSSDATLLVAKLDRLSRNAAFLNDLENKAYRGALKIKALDLPEFNGLMVGILAAVAQQERRNTSERTRKALAERKASGMKLGNPTLRTKKGLASQLAKMKGTQKRNAGERNAAALAVLLKKVKSPSDFLAWRKKPSDVMDYLNRRHIDTPGGCRFTPAAAARLMDNHLRPVIQ